MDSADDSPASQMGGTEPIFSELLRSSHEAAAAAFAFRCCSLILASNFSDVRFPSLYRSTILKHHRPNSGLSIQLSAFSFTPRVFTARSRSIAFSPMLRT